MNQKNIIIAVVVGLIVLGLGGYMMRDRSVEPIVEADKGVTLQAYPDIKSSPQISEQKKVEESVPFVPEMREDVAEELILPVDASLMERFDFVLKKMLVEVSSRAQEYKKERKVLRELTRPENLRDKAYVEENFLIIQDIVPELYKKAEGILEVFEKADAEIQALAEKQPEEKRAVVLAQWQKLKQKHAGAYQAFFELEDDVIKAHERLMRFYFVKQELYAVDPDSDEIVFVNENDERLSKKLRLRINRLSRTQKEAFRRN